jgi:hypothetical protein
MNLYQWAKHWNVSFAALQDLKQRMGWEPTPQEAFHGLSEAAVTSRIRKEAGEKDVLLWRNNVGALLDARGVPVRYGLCNESPAMNRQFKSSDWIGIRKRTIEPHDVGTIIGQFVAREVKESAWRYTGTAREEAQQRYITLVAAYGGDACFANAEGTL